MGNEEEFEAVLMDYIERYGLTEKARALLCPNTTAGKPVPTATTPA